VDAISDKKIEEYISKLSSPASAVLHDLYRKTNLEMLFPRMISGHIQGKFLEMVSLMLMPRRILEIGTFTGYGAISLARGLTDDGKLITIEENEELEEVILNFIKKSGYQGKIIPVFGDALQIIPDIGEWFDLVFIDADKENYSNYFNLVIDKLRPGGFILADNVLWGGKVIRPEIDDEETLAIRHFNEMVAADVRVEQLLLPVRDGIMIIRKN
jgi:predicted O-methyltransferase YrrM